MKLGDIVEFNGKRFVAVGHDRRGWYYSPTTKAGDRPDKRKDIQFLLNPVKVGECDPKWLGKSPDTEQDR